MFRNEIELIITKKRFFFKFYWIVLRQLRILLGFWVLFKVLFRVF